VADGRRDAPGSAYPWSGEAVSFRPLGRAMNLLLVVPLVSSASSCCGAATYVIVQRGRQRTELAIRRAELGLEHHRLNKAMEIYATAASRGDLDCLVRLVAVIVGPEIPLQERPARAAPARTAPRTPASTAARGARRAVPVRAAEPYLVTGAGSDDP
jgi:hypothetical protein